MHLENPAIHPERTLLTIRGVTHSYREGDRLRPVLRGIDGEIGEGRFVALLGQSGSGKSTLLNLIAGLDMADSGSIIVQTFELNRLREPERTLFRRRHIGFVHQFFNLLPTLTVLENVALPGELNGFSADESRHRAVMLLDEVGLGDRHDSYPDSLSGGEQQRVALARALVHDPLLILADEPTGNLDSATGRHILDLLDHTVRRRGKTLLVATHSREVAERADAVWELCDGKLMF
ncbi:ABC transporter ATP-binding protein [Methylocaldum sp.]|uniref:ABC transporter ATP-binding protein n=1 Tax=Methylocaldum sp. TaxID=1969727 RepID=UPI002D2287CD|nr:ABC transporter ATP-binding protein [Methylocaldum sp.]HYE35753.1 ABC transporter ATP-binding protein [Methylocaldum sp.]